MSCDVYWTQVLDRRGRYRSILPAWIFAASFCAWGQASSELTGIPDGANWFDQPEILCTALQKQGVRAGAWGPIAGGTPVHGCEYPPVVRPFDSAAAIVGMLAAGQPPLPLTLAFHVSGVRPTQADTITIAITISSPDAKEEAKKLMLQCIKSLYEVIGQRLPVAVPAYLQREERFLSHQRYGIVSLFVTSTPKQQVLWFRLGKNPE
ncbi:MAG: hypothetical protein C5B51_11055 [Terriglobia bacterium]|nr:MAG: hypothetical protein C5B51_11055 [Terriglobia bacterium]